VTQHLENISRGFEDIRRRLRRELRDHHRRQDDLILGSCTAEPDPDPDDRPTRATPNGRQPIRASDEVLGRPQLSAVSLQQYNAVPHGRRCN